MGWKVPWVGFIRRKEPPLLGVDSKRFDGLSLPVHERFQSGVLVQHGIYADDRLKDIAEISSEQQAAFDASYIDLLRRIWAGLIESPSGCLDAEAATFAELDRSTRRYLWTTCHRDKPASFLTPTYTYSADLPDISGSVDMEGAGKSVRLSVPIVHDLMSTDFVELGRRACEDGSLSLKSPISGATCKTTLSMVPTEVIYWYKFYDADADTAFFVVGALHHCRVVCLYLPETQCVIMRSASNRALMKEQFGGEVDHVLLRHVAIYCAEIANYFQSPSRKIALLFGEEHMNHHLWNELSGIDALLRAPAPPSPMVIEMSAKSEMYGNLEAVFPEFEGKVVRAYSDRAELIGSFYSQDLCIIRVTGILIAASLRERIKSIVTGSLGRQIEAMPTVAFVLRIENRTLSDCVSFYAECGRYIASKLGKVRFIIDGRIRSPRDEAIGSEGEAGAATSVLNLEIIIASQLADELRSLGAEVVVNVDKQVYENLFWLYQSRFFVGAWGTGLTRARWLANVPGLMFTNTWNLEKHHDFHLYDSPRFIEDPTPLLFASKAAIVDRPDLSTIVPARVHFGENFDVLFEKIRGQIDELITMSAP